MKFRLFRREFSKRELKRFPELEHFSLPEDRWLEFKLRMIASWPFMAVAFVLLFVINPLYHAAVQRILQSDVVHTVAMGFFMAFSVDPKHMITAAALFLASSLLLPLVQGGALCVLLIRTMPVRVMNVYHRALRERGVYYCPNFTCRYDCTGIRGNTCPECGARVPGLSPA